MTEHATSDLIRETPALRRGTRRWQAVGSVLMLVLVLAFPAYKAVESTRRSDALTAQESALIASGHQIWSLNCASCHGTSGEGGSAPALNSQEFLSSVTDEQMRGIIAGGIPGTEMPAWWNGYGGPLTDQQLQAVVTYIRSWEKTAPSVPDWRSPAPSTGTGG